jgi:hypothetical protein
MQNDDVELRASYLQHMRVVAVSSLSLVIILCLGSFTMSKLLGIGFGTALFWAMQTSMVRLT